MVAFCITRAVFIVSKPSIDKAFRVLQQKVKICITTYPFIALKLSIDKAFRVLQQKARKKQILYYNVIHVKN